MLSYDAAMLRGRSAEAFSMLGKPCVGARYTGHGDAHILEPDARCAVCGRLAANAHHHPPKGMGGGSFELPTPRGAVILRPPLIAVCGFGNASGCHGLLHSGAALIRWEWDSDALERDWLEGRMRRELYGNDPLLFAMGRYVVEYGGEWKEVRPACSDWSGTRQI